MLKEQEKKRIKYSNFEKVEFGLPQIILDFQLKSHENFLCKFIEKFRQVDRDQNGIIDEREMRELVKIIDPRGEMGMQIDEMLDLLDPFSNDIITFSSVVTLLSSVNFIYPAINQLWRQAVVGPTPSIPGISPILISSLQRLVRSANCACNLNGNGSKLHAGSSRAGRATKGE